MSEKNLPEAGVKVSVEKFHVSKMNARADEPFGKSEEDQLLIANLRRSRIIGPFKARPESDGFGVYMGRRRFLAKKTIGMKHFVVGTDCIIEELNDEEAREASLIENLQILRKDMDPLTRAERLNEIISFSARSLRGTAAHLGLSPSTLSEWLKVLDLGPRMRESLRKGLISFHTGLVVAKMELGVEKQADLAEVLETEGSEAFKRELDRIPTGKMKRGIPKGVYEIDRVVWDTRNRKEMDPLKVVDKAAEKKGMKRPEYIKAFIIKHIDEIAKETA